MFRKRRTREIPVISTAPLTDIIFILLFFFMVTSTIRMNSTRVKVKLPSTQTAEKKKDEETVCYIYIGEPMGNVAAGPGGMAVQVNDQVVDITQLVTVVTTERAKLPKYKQDKFIVSLKIHRDAKMKLVKEVKQLLKDAGALQIDYSGAQTLN